MSPLRKPKKLHFFALLLAVLDIASCQEIEQEEEEMRVAYGSPTANYSVKGKVTDEQGNPIPELEITLSAVVSQTLPGGRYNESITRMHDFSGMGSSFKTDQKGNYDFQLHGWPANELQINVKDTDGAANGGQFAEDSVRTTQVAFVKNKKDTNPWYWGEAKVEMPTVKLKKQ